jgi:predicted DNA-binding transcriptional regulator YafY
MGRNPQDGATRTILEQLRGAIETNHVVQAAYGDEKSQITERRLRPMALLFWGNVWTLVAWCELRVDFRSFRADRFKSVEILPETFEPEKGQRYEDFVERVRQQFGPSADGRPAI